MNDTPQIKITDALQQAILAGMKDLDQTQSESISVGQDGMILVRKGSKSESDRKNVVTYLGDFVDEKNNNYVLFAA